jgi:hypothetical protein
VAELSAAAVVAPSVAAVAELSAAAVVAPSVAAVAARCQVVARYLARRPQAAAKFWLLQALPSGPAYWAAC